MVRSGALYAAPPPALRGALREGDMRLLFDASALTKRYASEVGRSRVLVLIDTASELLIAAHCKTELASALLRRRGEGRLPAGEFERAWQAAQDDVADMTVVPLDARVERFAFSAMVQGPLSGMDALHIASALVGQVDLFVTADKRQAQVARSMGLPTELIEN